MRQQGVVYEYWLEGQYNNDIPNYCQFGAIAGKTFKCALVWANFLSWQAFAAAVGF